MKTNKALLLVCVLAAPVFIFISGCATTKCSRPGQIIWDKDLNPDRNAPKWTRDMKAAAKLVGVKQKTIPKKNIVIVGISKDMNNQRSAKADALDNLLKQYAVSLKKELDGFMEKAANNLGLSLPNIDTALGANRSARFIPDRSYESEFVKESWEAHGKKCLESGEEPVFRVYIIGVIDKESRKSHVLRAAKESFKYAVIRKEQKNKILQELEKLISKS